jgi:hypothetical protein
MPLEKNNVIHSGDPETLLENDNSKDIQLGSDQGAPTIAPGMSTHDQLEKKAAPKEVENGDSTNVSRLYLDRTPGD